MTYRKYFYVFLVLILQIAICREFGAYDYSRAGYQYQLGNRRIQSRYIRMKYNNNNPTKNIKYPDSYNQYPNIERRQSYKLSPHQRYSPSYYRFKYN